MNITELVFKFGAVGGTARWSAKHYLRLKKPNLTNVEVMKEMVEFRYKIIKDDQIKNKLIERLAYLDNLTDFTFSILQLEGVLKTTEMPMHLQMQATAVIIGELKKKGVPEDTIIGPNQ